MIEIDDIKMIDWQQFEPEALGGDLAEELCEVINCTIKYGLTRWWGLKGFKKENKLQYLSLKGSYDKVLRPSVCFAKTTATAIKFNIYDEKTVGIKEFMARDRYIKLLRSSAVKHCANVDGGWGCAREFMSTAYELIFASWLVWDKLNERDKRYVLNIINSEIDVAFNAEQEYNYSLDGSCLDDGESKTIVDMEYANLLFLVSVMASKNKQTELYRAKAIKFYRACFSSCKNPDIGGFNVGEDWIIRRFGAKSPLAISYLGVGIKAYILSKLAGEENVPNGLVRNFEQIYKTFYSYEKTSDGIKTGGFISFDKKGRPCSEVKYPDGNKNGKANACAFYTMDIFAFCLGYENVIDISSREWAKVRMKDILKSVQKKGKYSTQGANLFKNMHGEAVCSQLADCYMALFMYIATKKTESVENIEESDFEQELGKKQINGEE